MKRIAVVLAVSLFATAASAATAGGVLNVFGTINSSMSVTIEVGGGTFSGGGTNTATSSLGTITKYGAVPSGCEITRRVSDWTLASFVIVKVVKANLDSASYTLSGSLGTTPSAGLTWKVATKTMVTTPTVLVSAGTYGATPSTLWEIVIADSVAAQTPVGNVLNFIATAN
jgi:hypothetical protein